VKIRELTDKVPIGDKMPNWGLGIGCWILGTGEYIEIHWNKLQLTGKAGIE